MAYDINLFYILTSISFIGILSSTHFFGLLKLLSRINNFKVYSINFAAGVLLTSAFYHLLPESYKRLLVFSATSSILLGFLLFFLLETSFKLFKQKHPSLNNYNTDIYINSLLQIINKFLAGVAVAIGFMHSTKMGIVNAFAALINEIPLAISDLAIYESKEASRSTSIAIKILYAISSILGATFTYFFQHLIFKEIEQILAFIAGGFLYLSATKIIPQIQGEIRYNNLILITSLLLLGIASVILTDALILKL